MVITLNNIGRRLEKCSGSIKDFVKSFLRNISIFKKLLHFSLGENANQVLQRIFLRFLSFG